MAATRHNPSVCVGAEVINPTKGKTVNRDELHELLDDYNIDVDLFTEWMDRVNPGAGLDGASWVEVDDFQDAYLGEHTLAEYAEDLIRDCYGIPDYLDTYIDWEQMGRDMEINGEVYMIGDHLFREA